MQSRRRDRYVWTVSEPPGEPTVERAYRRLVDLHRRGVDTNPGHDQDEGSFAWLVRRNFVETDLLVDQGLMAQSARKKRTDLL